MQKKNESINEVIKRYQESTASAEASREFHRENPNFCEETIAYFKRMGELAERAATKEDVEEYAQILKSKINGHERRINDLDYRVKHLEQLATHTKIAVDSNTAISKQNLELSKAISETVNQLSKPKPISMPAIKRVPWQAWLAISGGILLVYAMLTGQLAELAEVLKGVPKK